MCGIVGIIGKMPRNWSEEIINMTNAIEHRGPDDWGYIALNPGVKVKSKPLKKKFDHRKKVFLGHRRLSIIDLAGSKQPLHNEDGSVWVVFNGEIYNYQELAVLLENKGHILKEKGDTEVLVHLWEEFGEKMVDHLVGMFAFAIYDTNSDILYLARDRFGQKPLFYWENNDFFAFASELQAFWEIDNFPFDNIRADAIAQYFRHGYIPAPKTAFQGVYTVPQGNYLVKKNVDLCLTQYWRPRVSGELHEVDYDELQEILDRSVKQRMISDVPLGAFLSGGIDSSLVTSSMIRQINGKVQTYTISSGNNWFDESKEAELIARHLGSDHHTFKIEPDLVDISSKLARNYGQPFADYSAVPSYYLSRETRKHVKVALTGDGGDELFAGYDHYRFAHWYRRFGGVPDLVKFAAGQLMQLFTLNSFYGNRIANSLFSLNNIELKGENNSWAFHSYWQASGFRKEFLQEIENAGEKELYRYREYYREGVSDDPVDRWQEANQRMYLCDDILAKVDIASMANSLECRAPLLDHRFAEFANRISPETKLKYGQGKYILRDLARKFLPSEIIDLPKKGFTLPLAQWMRSGLKEWAYDIIFKHSDLWSFYLQPEFVEKIWENHQNERMDHSMRLWLVICLVLWKKNLHRSYS